MISLLFITINLFASCTKQEMYEIALNKAKIEYPVMNKSSIYDYKVMKTTYGYACIIYFNKTHDATNAHMVLITMDNNCNIKQIEKPTISTFYLKSKSKCKTLGTIVGDNHDLIVNKCGVKYQFKASNDALSRYFSENEILKISKIYKLAEKKYSSFSNKQVLYNVNGLKIWVRLYSSSRWFLVFDITSIAPYPASPKASVWIESTKFKKLTKMIDKKTIKQTSTIDKKVNLEFLNVNWRDKFKYVVWGTNIVEYFNNKKSIGNLPLYIIPNQIKNVIKDELSLIKKSYPNKPLPPEINKRKILTKDKFEKTVEYKQRKKQYEEERKRYLKGIETNFKKKMALYNKKLKVYKNKKVKENMNLIKNYITSKTYASIYGKACITFNRL